MSSLQLRKVWKITEALLTRARAALPEPPPQTGGEFSRLDGLFQEYLDQNEHELALDTLTDLGLTVLPRGGFWKDLKRAALNMGLPDRIPLFEAEFAKSISRISNSE